MSNDRKPRIPAPRTWARHVLGVAALLALGTPLLGCDRPTKPRAVAATPADSTPTPDPSPADTLRVLFIGNSLTGVNDLPGMVVALSVAAHDTVTIVVRSDVRNGFSLLDHIDGGDAAAALLDGPWDVVALQQGPSALPESRVELLSSTRTLTDMIHAQGGRPALYMVWPSRSRLFDLNAVIESYALAAESVDGLLFPAGLAWKIAWAEDPNFPLYGEDDFHPSTLGTYVAALCTYAELKGGDPMGMPTVFDMGDFHVEIPPEQADLAQRAAAQAIAQYRQARSAPPGE
jgi:hypothetical protein